MKTKWNKHCTRKRAEMEIGQLQNTASKLRDNLEQREREIDQAIDEERSRSIAEAQQLMNTASNLRDALENCEKRSTGARRGKVSFFSKSNN